jgi:hypothetical protein
MHVTSNNLKACPASPYDAGDMTSDMTSIIEKSTQQMV